MPAKQTPTPAVTCNHCAGWCNGNGVRSSTDGR
jgi:hypothetical protein